MAWRSPSFRTRTTIQQFLAAFCSSCSGLRSRIATRFAASRKYGLPHLLQRTSRRLTDTVSTRSTTCSTTTRTAPAAGCRALHARRRAERPRLLGRAPGERRRGRANRVRGERLRYYVPDLAGGLYDERLLALEFIKGQIVYQRSAGDGAYFARPYKIEDGAVHVPPGPARRAAPSVLPGDALKLGASRECVRLDYRSIIGWTRTSTSQPTAPARWPPGVPRRRPCGPNASMSTSLQPLMTAPCR